MMLLLIMLNEGCASSQIPSPPPLQETVFLRLCPDSAGACRSYEVCKKKVLGICTKKEWIEEKFDLTDEKIRNDLINMGFELRRPPN